MDVRNLLPIRVTHDVAVRLDFGRPGWREVASYIRDYRSRLSLYLPYRIQYSIGNFACIRHPQDNNPV